MTDKEFKELLKDVLRMLEESETKEEAMEKIKNKYIKNDKKE